MAERGTTFSLSQNLTGTAPTTATEGQSLRDLEAVTVIVEVANPATQTLSGAGTLQFYIYDGSPGGPGAWSRLPALDLAVTLSGAARMAFESVDVIGPRNARGLWVPNGVTVSAGTTVTVYQLGHDREGVY